MADEGKKKGKKKGGKKKAAAGLNYLGVKAGKAARFPVSYIEPGLRDKLRAAAEKQGVSTAAFVMGIIEKAVK